MRNKNIKKIMGGFLALAMTLTMTMGSATAVKAAPTGGTLAAPATAYFAKTLNVPAGVANPVSGSFSFTWAKVDLDGSTATADLATMPTLTPVTLDPLGDANAHTSDIKDAGSNVIGTAHSVSSPNIVEGITFPQPGIYTYKLTEDADQYTGTLPGTDSITYSQAEYKVAIQVALDTASGSTYVENIAVTPDKVDSGSPGTGKVDQDSDSSTPETNKFKFINGYKQTAGGTTPSGKPGVLELSKTVMNAPADGVPTGVATTFDFKVTLEKAPSEVGTPTYAYDVYKSGVDAPTSETVAFAQDAATADVDVTLSTGDYVIFKDLPVGTKYSVTENSGNVIGNYNTSYVVTNADTTATPLEVKAMAVPVQTIEAVGGHSAACTNRYFSTSTPTGILLNNLPFILLIVVAIGAVVAFIVVKRRRAQH